MTFRNLLTRNKTTHGVPKATDRAVGRIRCISGAVLTGICRQCFRCNAAKNSLKLFLMLEKELRIARRRQRGQGRRRAGLRSANTSLLEHNSDAGSRAAEVGGFICVIRRSVIPRFAGRRFPEYRDQMHSRHRRRHGEEAGAVTYQRDSGNLR